MIICIYLCEGIVFMELSTFFKENSKAAIAMSGGVDSTYLLAKAAEAGVDIRAYFVKSAFQPEFELRDAIAMAECCGVRLEVLNVDILSNHDVRANPHDRCYYCKKAIFSAIIEAALQDGYSLIVDGTNASDDVGDRPGTRALCELEVRSPLRECGLTKDEIRRHSHEMGLKTASKPAYACLATRIPTGEAITDETLARIEGAEEELFKLGYTDFRIRVFSGAARIQLPGEQIARAAVERDSIIKAIEPWFHDIFLDLKGR